MKTLGIIGGIGPESTVVYHRSIVASYREQKQDGSYPSILINSIDLTKMLGLIGNNQLTEVTEYLVGEVQKLAQAGADFVADALRKALPNTVEVVSITGSLPPAEREARIEQMGESEKHVLVCTDCLSEGINLQEHFGAVVHYDLSWNPTRHEQREGRVDRFGQKTPKVRVLTYYGTDNQIDGIVLDVLLRKHRTIRSSLGISVPVPVGTEKVVEAIFEGLLLKSKPSAMDNYLPGFEEYMRPIREDLYGKWDAVTEREKRSRTLFAQETIKVEEVSRELQSAQDAVGSGVDVQSFTRNALQMIGASVQGTSSIQVDVIEAPQGLKDLLNQSLGSGYKPKFSARFDLPIKDRTYAKL